MKAYITLDYELFMGTKVGTINNCLIKPMNALTKMLDKYNIKCNIFVDAAYLLRLYQLKENKQIEEQFQLVTQHIQNLSKQGHAILFHFHPQWLYSKYEDGWIMDFEHYKISDMPLEDIKIFIPQAIELLQSYSCNKLKAFRAGGYSFPNEACFGEILRKYEIDIDSSVLKGARVQSKYQSYDYANVPTKSPYRFDKDLSIIDNDGYFTEYPISTIKMLGFKYFFLKQSLTRRYNALFGHDKYGDGKGIGIAGNKSYRLIYKVKRLITPSVISATIDGSFSLCLDYVYKKHCTAVNDNAFIIIGHPKNLSEKSISIFERFVMNHPEIKFGLFKSLN